MINNQQVGRNMMLLRLQKGLSQQGLAEMCNVTHQAVSKWETGAALPDMETLLFLSKYFGVSMEEILSGVLSLDVRDAAPDPSDVETFPAVTIPETPLAPKVPPVTEEGIPVMGWNQIVDLAPFASRETLEALAEHCIESLDKEKLCDLAPFLSPAYLDKIVRRQDSVGPELALNLAPFLSKETLDWLLLGGKK